MDDTTAGHPTGRRGHPKGHREVKAEEHQERMRQALELRKAGATYQQIADRLGWKTHKGAHDAVTRALKLIARQPAEEVKDLELTRLDAMIMAIWPRVRQGDHVAIDRVIRIMDRRAKLLGLDAPTRHVVEDWRKDAENHGVNPAEVFERMVREFSEQMAGPSGGGGVAGSETP